MPHTSALPRHPISLLRTGLIGLLAFGAAAATPTTSSAAQAPVVIYGDSLASGWADWSWNTTVNWQDTTDPHSGQYDTAFTYNAAWDGLSVYSDSLIDTTPYDQVQFWINGGTAGGQKIWLYVNYPGGGSGPTTDITPYVQGNAIVAGTWSLVDVPLSALGATATQIDRLTLFNNTAGSQPTLYMDDLSLLNDGTPPPPPPTANLDVTVDATAGVHPISPYIYGVAYGGSFLKENNLTLDRWGGNPTSRYNWRLGSAMNTASDWYFENTDNGNSCTAPSCAVDQMVAGDQSAGAASLITVPTLGWVAKDTSLDTCGFSVAKYGPQQQTDPYRPNCGNGVNTSGQNITGNAPSDTSVPSTPADIQAWVSHLVATFGTAARGGVRFYAMDNEPELWYSTHRDVAPDPLTYDGLYNEFETYATAVKSVDPSAMIDGPIPWGWSAYFDSSYDYVHQTESDQQAHGGLPIIPWFLQTVQAHDQETGQRTLDVLDIHYYPQGNNVFAGATDPATDALRLRETRALWDPTYTDESWINARVDLIPRMDAWINQYYPGTKLGISEWNWGADNTMNGALAIANVLGIYGQEGIYLASYWTHPAAGSPGALAFDMYRNYDGQDSTFGNDSVQTVSSAPSSLMAFGSLRTSDGKLLVMLVNQGPDTQEDVQLSVKDFAPGSMAQVYELGPATPDIVNTGSISASPSISIPVPPDTIELVVMPRAHPVVTAGSPTVTYGQADAGLTYWTPSNQLCQQPGPPNPYCKPRPVNPIVTCSYTGLEGGVTAPAIIATGLTSAPPGAPAGSYPTLCWGAYDPSYTFSYVGGMLTVNPASLTIAPNHATVDYGGSLPRLEWKANFVNHDTASSLSRQPTCRAGVRVDRRGHVDSPAGRYRIRCAGAQDSNYRMRYAAGVLRIMLGHTKLTYDGPTSIMRMRRVRLSARLTSSAGSAIARRAIKFLLGKGSAKRRCTGLTNSHGEAGCTISQLMGAKGPEVLNVVFRGDRKGPNHDYGPAKTIVVVRSN